MDTAQKTVGFEISDLDDLDPAKITHRVVLTRDEDGNEVSGLIIVGKNSQQYVDVQNKIRIDNLQRSAKRTAAIDTKTEEGASKVAEIIDSNDRATALAVTVGWFGFNLEGQPATFDIKVVERMFTKLPEWEASVIRELNVNENFMKV